MYVHLNLRLYQSIAKRTFPSRLLFPYFREVGHMSHSSTGFYPGRWQLKVCHSIVQESHLLWQQGWLLDYHCFSKDGSWTTTVFTFWLIGQFLMQVSNRPLSIIIWANPYKWFDFTDRAHFLYLGPSLLLPMFCYSIWNNTWKMLWIKWASTTTLNKLKKKKKKEKHLIENFIRIYVLWHHMKLLFPLYEEL